MKISLWLLSSYDDRAGVSAILMASLNGFGKSLPTLVAICLLRAAWLSSQWSHQGSSFIICSWEGASFRACPADWGSYMQLSFNPTVDWKLLPQVCLCCPSGFSKHTPQKIFCTFHFILASASWGTEPMYLVLSSEI